MAKKKTATEGVIEHRLYFGPYQTPRFRYGDRVQCEVRGEVIIVGLKDCPIPWPIARLPSSSSRGLVIYKGLAKALRCESASAVCKAWGVRPPRVSAWRSALGIGPDTEGSRELRREYGKRNFDRVRPALWATLHDPERAAKISAAKKGKPRPQHVLDAMHKANRGRKATAATRRRMSEAHKRRWAERKAGDES